MNAQQSMKVEVAGIIHQHRIARLEQKAAQKIDRLRAGFHQHDVFGGHFYAVLTQTSGEELAQERQSERRSIIGECGVIRTCQRPERSAQGCLRHP